MLELFIHPKDMFFSSAHIIPLVTRKPITIFCKQTFRACFRKWSPERYRFIFMLVSVFKSILKDNFKHQIGNLEPNSA